MREIRMLRAMWRALETEATAIPKRARRWKRRIQPRSCLRVTAPVLDPTRPFVGAAAEVSFDVNQDGHGKSL